MIPNHYQTLGILPTASKDEIKKAYRQLALQFHPDRNKSPNAHEKFIEINEAYLILFDEKARAKYDREYKYYYCKKARTEQTSSSYQEKTNQEKEYKHTYSSKREPQFEDEDLNQWTRNAREQAEGFAKMAFDEFSNRVVSMVKEMGFQLGNAFLLMIGLLLAMGGCGSFALGVVSKWEIGNPILGIILLFIGIKLYAKARENYDNHKPN
jgi:DnaJ-class molecular chaperone